jgi:hypothetical protein
METNKEYWENRFDDEFCWQPPLGKKSIRFVRIENTKLTDQIELNGYEDQLVKDLKQFIKSLLSTQEEKIRKEERKRLENEFGDFAHEQYMGNEEWNGTRVYGYKKEVCNLVEEYFSQTK